MGGGSAHGPDVARAGPRYELDEPEPLGAVIAADSGDHALHSWNFGLRGGGIHGFFVRVRDEEIRVS